MPCSRRQKSTHKNDNLRMSEKKEKKTDNAVPDFLETRFAMAKRFFWGGQPRPKMNQEKCN